MQASAHSRKRSFFKGPLHFTPLMPTTPMSVMRSFLIAVGLLTQLGCRCSPTDPQAVTLRIKNASRDTLFVADSDQRIGLTVQRQVGGEWFGFDDEPCPCATCARECDRTCQCPDAGQAFARVIRPDGTAERLWSGVVKVAAQGACASCLLDENAPYDETFRLELCYVTRLECAAASADAGRVPCELPPKSSRTCVTQTFTPRQQVVEIGPRRGSSCTSSAECQGKDELCFAGSCTASCPSNGVPLRAPLSVAAPSNQGFFNVLTDSDAGIRRLTGAGRISGVVFQGTTLSVSLERVDMMGERVRGQVQVELPPGLGAPLAVDAGVSVEVRQDTRQQGNAAVVIRDSANTLLFAADNALSRRLLLSADVAPFEVEDTPTPFGCSQQTCGKALFFNTKLTAPGAVLELEAGKSASINTQVGTYRFVAASNAVYQAPNTCDVDSQRPFALWRERGP
jgi:hypothetical protein